MSDRIVTARIQVWNGGRYGRPGEYIARVIPDYFKNGQIKKTEFTVIEVLNIVKLGYRANCNAAQSERIVEVLED